MNVTSFMRLLRDLDTPNAFNPYRDSCPVYDLVGAASLRASVLQSILQRAVKNEIDSIWIGRDLGHRGGRRTGLALTDDVHYLAHGARWNISTRICTKGPAFAERTAAVIWSVLAHIEENVFLWNVFPLHPHLPGVPFSNRAHSPRERILGEAMLGHLVGLLDPRRILAIGNDAAKSAERCSEGRPVYCVRHPSYGGQREFLHGVHDLYPKQRTGIPQKQARLVI